MRNLLPKEWRLISDLNAHAFMNMAVDEAIAISCVGVGLKPTPTIRFYTWRRPAVSIGYFQRITPVINWLNNSPSLNTPLYPLLIEGKGTIDIVRRPTGGGVVLHGADLTYAVATGLPRGFAPRPVAICYGARNDNSSRNLIPPFYKHMGQAVIEGLRLLGITASLESEVKSQKSRVVDSRLSLCAQTPVEFDVLVIPPNPPFNKGGNGGIKVAGCAARRFGDTLLLQGYISIGHIADITAQQLIDAMIKGFMVSLDIKLLHEKLTDEEASLAEELNRKKYSRREWNYRR